MQAEELRSWLHLLTAVSRGGARRLLARFGSPEAVLSTAPAQRAALLKAEQAAALQTPPDTLLPLVDRTLTWLVGSASRSVLVLGDADYPPALLATADPPLLLYLDGRRELLSRRCVAVVGSRRPSLSGEDHARHFAEGLGQAGFCVVSGLALGIDGAAHEGALNTEGGTLAVLGCGVDQVYPLAHAELARHIARRGLLVSEYPVGTPPIALHFPQRNRIIAGLSEGCLVVEAAVKSGSLITARLAAEAGREVFAVPGPIRSAQSQGCHHLLKQGACLVQSLDDLLQELRPMAAPSASQAPLQPPHTDPAADTRFRASSRRPPAAEPPTHVTQDADSHPLLSALGHSPMSLEQLAQRSGWSLQELQVQLLELELDGRVARLPGAMFQRRTTA